MNKPSIRFMSNLIPLIYSGEKVLTYRKGNKYAVLEIGDVIPFVDSGKDEEVGKLKITTQHSTLYLLTAPGTRNTNLKSIKNKCLKVTMEI